MLQHISERLGEAAGEVQRSLVNLPCTSHSSFPISPWFSPCLGFAGGAGLEEDSWGMLVPE